MNFGSVCSGIEAASTAWGLDSLGWRAQWFSEIEPFPCAVLAHRHPGVPNLGDMTKIYDKTEFRQRHLDVLCGGTPCQSFSIAGLRKGLDDPRGNLALEFPRIAEIRKPRWILWENVPGVLSSNDGRDFASFVTALGALGYGWSYRVLDAQFFGVPQRRRRVFVVGYLGDWRPPAAVLLEPESLCRYASSRNKKGAQVAGTLGGGTKKAGFAVDFDRLGALVGVPFRKVHRAASAADNETWEKAEISNTLNSFDTGERDTHAQDSRLLEVKVCPQLNAKAGTGGGNLPLVADQYSVRRLTPKECERLQGFPDGYTDISYKNRKECPDGPRYKALGNSWAVPCARWIGRRIEKVERIMNEQNLGDLL